MATFVNLTPHDVNVMRTDGTIMHIPRSGTVARCSVTSVDCGVDDGIQLSYVEFGDVYDLPETSLGTYYIVSMLVRQALPHRCDLVSPGELIRNDEGVVIACKGFTCNY